MKTFLVLIPVVLIVGAFLLWQLWFTILIGVKERPYKVVAKKQGYELRKIQSYLTAHVDLIGSYEQTVNEGFKILFAYISGNNHTRDCMSMKIPLLHEACQKGISIPMTAPVLSGEGEKISMTAPVTTDSSPRAESHRTSFILPQSYTIETAPQPRDKRILLEQEPAKTIAVYSFTWYPTAKRVEEQKAVFRKMIKRDGLCLRSAISLARYNPPFILPFLMRNELIVTVEQNSIQGMACKAMRD